MSSRTQAERSEATRAALMQAGRRLFAERGYAEVGTEEIVRQAGVTRGALYHHFDGKRELLAAVYEQIESEIAGRLGESVTPGAGPLETLEAGAEMFLDHCLEPEVQQIVLLDAPGGPRLGAMARDRRPLRPRADRGAPDRRNGGRRDQAPADRAARPRIARGPGRGRDAGRARGRSSGPRGPRPARRLPACWVPCGPS